MLDGQIAWLTYLASGYFATGEVPQPYGSAHPSIVPYQAMRTKDGYLMVAVGNDALWRRFAPLLGLDALVDDVRFATNPDRVRNRDVLIPLLEKELSARTSAEWAHDLAAVGIPAGPINTIDTALEHPQVEYRDMVLTVEHPTEGDVRMVGSPIKLNGHTPAPSTAPPTLGEHTDEVLAELGFSGVDIRALHDTGVVR